mmetsp:Transcript_22151/g.44594  ORF Transcript_22151/g.44594 Transcript_22151/m.44594 type:complete len:109 (-) Transcript_22151:224-550(-)
MSFTGKRTADVCLESPAKKLKEYFHDGFVQYGEGWANQQFAAAAQQGVLEDVQGDIMLADVPEQNCGPTENTETMMIDAQKEEEWWAWWSNKWKQPQVEMMVPDCLGR